MPSADTTPMALAGNPSHSQPAASNGRQQSLSFYSPSLTIDFPGCTCYVPFVCGPDPNAGWTISFYPPSSHLYLGMSASPDPLLCIASCSRVERSTLSFCFIQPAEARLYAIQEHGPIDLERPNRLFCRPVLFKASLWIVEVCNTLGSLASLSRAQIEAHANKVETPTDAHGSL
jgi:hypothetical protein